MANHCTRVFCLGMNCLGRLLLKNHIITRTHNGVRYCIRTAYIFTTPGGTSSKSKASKYNIIYVMDVRMAFLNPGMKKKKGSATINQMDYYTEGAIKCFK